MISTNEASDSVSPATISEKAAPILNAPVQQIRWIEVLELSYQMKDDAGASQNTKGPVCFACGQVPTLDHPLKFCAQCHIAGYCSRECQVGDWKRRHKGAACASYQRLERPGQKNNEKGEGVTRGHWILSSLEKQCEARNEFFGRLRFYICPYAVFRHATLGRGFVFLQTNHTISMMSLAVPIDCWGHSLGMRSCTVHYLTLGEYDQEICRDDFEMTMVRKNLQEAVAEYDTLTQIVVLMRFRCGHLALGLTSLVPDYGLCQRLGKDYFATDPTMGSLLLNLDDSM